MKADIIVFRGAIAARAGRGAARGRTTQAIVRTIRREVPEREVLIAVWRRNPATGRLESRWTTVRAAAAGDGSSRRAGLRLAS